MLGLIVNIISFVLAIYISLRPVPPKIKKIIWAIVIFITIGNIYLYFTESKQEKLYFDILAPNITSKEAFNMVETTFGKELKDYKLIDVLGSYYICLKKPDVFFHRFPEWVFLFRNVVNNQLLEFKVTDGRIPDLVVWDLKEIRDLEGGRIVNHIKFKVSLQYLGGSNLPSKDITDHVVIFDEMGRSLINISGTSPRDDMNEVIESTNSMVFARVRVVGRPTDYVNDIRVIDNPHELGSIEIRKAPFKTNPFYNSLKPITNWTVDIDEVINNAIKKGAKAIAPGKTGMSGGPGVFRLNNSNQYNIKGSFWKIPYRVGIRPLLIDASTGDVYAVNNKGEYSTEWENNFDLEQIAEELKAKEDIKKPQVAEEMPKDIWINKASRDGQLGRINFIKVDWQNPSVVFAGASNPLFGGLLRIENFADGSSSAGLIVLPSKYTIEIPFSDPSRQMMGNREILSFAIDPKRASTLYVGFGGIFKSTDGGAIWEQVNKRPPVTSIVIDPTNPNIIYAGREIGSSKSYDGGKTWQDMENCPSYLYSFIIDPTKTTTLYAATFTGLYKSIDSGDTWEKILDKSVPSLVIDLANSEVLYAAIRNLTNKDGGIYKTIDGGKSWINTTLDLKLRDFWALAIDPNNSSVVYAGECSGGGVIKSSDGGYTWAPLNNGLTDKKVFSLAIDPKNSAIIWVGTDQEGVFRIVQSNE